MVVKTAGLILLVVGTFLFASTQGSVCRKYEGDYISYYSQIFRVKSCKRHMVTDQKKIRELAGRGVDFLTVDSDVIRAIPLAEREPSVSVDSKKLCRAVRGKYVSYSFVDIYYVEGCTKRLFPDWASYQEHRRNRRGDVSGAIVSLSWKEFTAIRTGENMPAASSSSPSIDYGVDIIPLIEACKGLENKYVSYYSKIYHIKNCHKKLVPYHLAREKQIFKELTSEQWISLPDK